MKILFVGDLRSPFIKDDLAMLKENHQVRTFDLAIHATSFRKCPQYLVSTLAETLQVSAADVIWIWFADYPALPFMVLGKIFRKPVVVNVGGWEVYGAEEIGYGNQLNPVRREGTRWILRNATTCIVMSRAYRNIIHNLIPQAIVEVIPGCIDTRFCDLPPLQKSGAITAYCTNSTYVLKGLHTFDMASEFLPGLKKLKNVPHQRLMHEFRTSKVYCQLSYTESFGMSLVEAMSCGCVPVVTDRDALPEVIGDTGIVVQFGNVFETVEAIKKAMTMSGEPAQERARTFSKEKRQDAIETLLGCL
jgi:glycosyltransferase involved in cell wall biosynthesis